MNKLKRTRFFSLGRKWIFTLALFLLVFAAASILKVQAASVITGWLWGGSEDANIGGSIGAKTWPPDGNETGVGMISMKGTTYEVTVPDFGCSGSACELKGYAWANASDSPGDPMSKPSNIQNGLGWIDFNPQNHCVTGAPDASKKQYQATAAGCSPPSGCSAGVSRSGNNLTGCAKVVSIAQASVTGNNGGWDGWIKFNGSKYQVDIDPLTGKFCSASNSYSFPAGCDNSNDTDKRCHCYAWSGEEGLTVTATQKNMANGLGGFDFSNAKTEEVCTLAFIPPTQKLINEKVNDTVQLEEVGTNCACRNVKIKDINTSIIDTLSPKTFPFFATNPTKDTATITIKTEEVTADTPFNGVAKATSDNCGEDMLNLLVQNVPVCALDCPSEIVLSPDEKKSVKSEIGITGETGCVPSAISCSESGTDAKGNINVNSRCDVSETGSLRYGSSELTATAGSGPSNSCTSPITVKGPGWIETNP